MINWREVGFGERFVCADEPKRLAAEKAKAEAMRAEAERGWAEERAEHIKHANEIDAALGDLSPRQRKRLEQSVKRWSRGETLDDCVVKYRMWRSLVNRGK